MTDQFELLYRLQIAGKRKLKNQTSIANILPPPEVDLVPYFTTLVPRDVKRSKSLDRQNIENHWKNLRFEARGRPEAVALLKLCTSYLRRKTPHTEQAWTLFERLWRDHTSELLENVFPRGLVSSFRTFSDHDPDEKRRLRAKLAFTYAHMIKLYETERQNEGHDLTSIQFDIPAPCPKIGVNQLWGARYGGDNSLEILHILLAEEVPRDDVLGPMILKIMSHIQNGHTIFSRFDQRRLACDFESDQDTNWSFGLNPLDEPKDEA